MVSPPLLPLIPAKSTGFTAVILTYDRLDSLYKIIHQVALAPSLAKVLVVWNNQQKPPPPGKLCSKSDTILSITKDVTLLLGSVGRINRKLIDNWTP